MLIEYLKQSMLVDLPSQLALMQDSFPDRRVLLWQPKDAETQMFPELNGSFMV